MFKTLNHEGFGIFGHLFLREISGGKRDFVSAMKFWEP